jgi:hypothetical protein
VIYLAHADGALPNLALMRLAAHFRTEGQEVRLVRGRDRHLWDPPGEVWGSSIFAFSAAKRAAVERSWGPVRWGGTGVRVESSLAEVAPIDWEAVRPDYSDYDLYPFSIGFTQRGCRLSCKFCVVPTKEGKPRPVHSISDIWRGEPWPRKIVLLDNDFFGQPREAWQERVRELCDGGYRVSFAQGINIRQVDEESAAALASLEYRDNEFQRRRLYTAWDNLGDEAAFRKGVELLRAAGIPPNHLTVYMLVGYAKGETWDAILHRFNEMVSLGCLPYPMVYNNARRDLKAFQRWAVTHLYKSVPWSEYRDPRLGTGSGNGMKISGGA